MFQLGFCKISLRAQTLIEVLDLLEPYMSHLELQNNDVFCFIQSFMISVKHLIVGSVHYMIQLASLCTYINK